MAILHFYDKKFHSAKQSKSSSKLRARSTSSSPVTEYSEIGIGKPLCIQISTIYIGDAPKKTFGGKSDLLVVSAVKGPATFDAAQKAINQIAPRISNRSYITPGSAMTKGTSIVYYTPALENSELAFDFHLITESFSDRGISRVQKLFQGASKMPMFITSSTQLIAGSAILGMIKKLGKAVLESAPFMEDTLKLRFNIGGYPNFRTGVKLICADDKEQFFGKDYTIDMKHSFNGDEEYFLINKNTGDRYEGEIPYMLINVDGKERRDLASFEPKIASAVLLSKFYNENTQDAAFETLESSFQLKQDLVYLKKAQKLKEEMAALDKESDEYKNFKNLFKAFEKNIQNEDILFLFKNTLMTAKQS